MLSTKEDVRRKRGSILRRGKLQNAAIGWLTDCPEGGREGRVGGCVVYLGQDCRRVAEVWAWKLLIAGLGLKESWWADGLDWSPIARDAPL
jgi:hypothetical protein